MDAISAFAVNALWQSGVIAIVALLAARCTRGHAKLQHALLVGAAALCAIVPLWSTFLVVPEARVSVVGAPPVAPSIDFATPLALLCVAFAFRRLAQLVRATLAARRLYASALDAPLPDDVRRELDALGSYAAVVRESEAVDSPVTVGAIRPRVLLPVARAWPDGALRVVLAHELAHVARRDGLVHAMVNWLTIPLAFHPLVALLLRRGAAAREMACDERVVRAAVEPRLCARTLLALAQERVAPALAFGDVAALELRLQHLASLPDERRRRNARVALAAAALVLASLALWLAHTPLLTARAPRDLSGTWVMNVAASNAGGLRPYESMTQTLIQRGDTLESRQHRVRGGGVVERVTWQVRLDGVTRPIRVSNRQRTRGSGRWSGDAVMLEMISPHGHHERFRVGVTADGKRLVSEGDVVQRSGAAPTHCKFIFERAR